MPNTASPAVVSLVPVGPGNWRDVANLSVAPEQREWVTVPSYYLALCHYGEAGWRPLAVLDGDEVAGFLMWTVDPADGAAWFGGIMIDAARQGRGLGRAAVSAAVSMLAAEHGITSFALSYEPANEAARRCYAGVGFAETGETEDTEVVARLRLPAA